MRRPLKGWEGRAGCLHNWGDRNATRPRSRSFGTLSASSPIEKPMVAITVTSDGTCAGNLSLVERGRISDLKG